MFVEVKTDNKVSKYYHVEHDLDTYIIKGIEDEIEDGFTYSNSCKTWTNCKQIHRDCVVAHYAEWDSVNSYYKGINVRCEDVDGRIKISTTTKPQMNLFEFKHEIVEVDRGSEHPPAYMDVYYKIIEADDINLNRDVIEHVRKDYSLVYPGMHDDMNDSEYKELRIKYLVKKIQSDFCVRDDYPISRMCWGCYGFSIWDEEGNVDFDIIFEKIIPAAYEELKRTPYGGQNFLIKLYNEILGVMNLSPYNDRRWSDTHTVLRDGKVIDITSDYREWCYKQCCIRVKKYYDIGVAPYCEMDMHGWPNYKE